MPRLCIFFEKKLLKARGLPHCEVQSGKAGGFGCCPCCEAQVTHQLKATTACNTLV